MVRLTLLVLAAALGCTGGGSSQPGGTDSAAVARQVVQVSALSRGDVIRGKRAIERYGCGSCHSIPGIRTARGLAAPPLSDYAARAFVAGQLSNTPDNLSRWIQSPDSVEPGTAMPDLGVDAATARDMVAYLYRGTITRALGPPHMLSPEGLREH